MRPPKGLLVPFLAPVIFWRLSRANLAIPKTPLVPELKMADEAAQKALEMTRKKMNQ
jgi:hypothetical protein